MNYKVGQIIFMSSPKSAQIIPLKVVEELVKTTENGKEVEYTVRFPDRSKTEANINALKGDVFSSIEEMEKYMIDNTTKAIKKMVVAAQELKLQAFPDNQKIKEETSFSEEERKEEKDISYVDLGDGTKAKINLKSFEKLAQ